MIVVMYPVTITRWRGQIDTMKPQSEIVLT